MTDRTRTADRTHAAAGATRTAVLTMNLGFRAVDIDLSAAANQPMTKDGLTRL
jgi:hypothetical protein